MAKQVINVNALDDRPLINVGSSPDAKNGAKLRDAFIQINDAIDRVDSNFNELYAATGADVQIPSQTNNANKYLKTDGTTLSWATVPGDGVGLFVTDFGEGFSLTAANKVVTNKLYSTNLTQPTQHYRLELDTNGVVHLPDQSIINGATLKTVPGNYAGITAGPVGRDEDSWVYVDNDGAWIATDYSDNAYTWHFDNTGALTLPNGGQLSDVYGGPLLSSAADKPVTIWTDNGMWGWEFGADGILRIQTYGEIAVEDDLGVRIGSFGTTVSPNSQIKIGGADHAFEIFGGPPGYSWQFGTDGLLTFPGANGFRATFGSVEPVGDVLHSVNSLYLESETTVGLTSGADVAELESTYLEQEELFANLRDEDISSSAPTIRPWAGMPSYEAYELIMAYIPGVGLPPPGSLAPAAYAASTAYYNWQSARTSAGVLINVADKQWVFGVAGDLRVPGTISKTNILQLNSSGTGGGAGNAASVSIDGDNGRLLVRTSDSETNKDWIFGLDGTTTFPNGVKFDGSEGNTFALTSGTVSKIDLRDDGGRGFYTDTGGFNLRGNGTYGWSFGTDGRLTLPGAVVKSTVAKTGAILPTTTGAVTNLDISPQYPGNLTNATYGPFTLGTTTLVVIVQNGNPVPFQLLTQPILTIGDVIGTIDSGDLGGTPGTTFTFSVSNVAQQTPTAIDLTKSVNKLTEGEYTLANGVEGQIMYMVPQASVNTASDVRVTVANFRVSTFTGTNGTMFPFRWYDGTGYIDNTGICTLIFTDGAWQQQGGSWS